MYASSRGQTPFTPNAQGTSVQLRPILFVGQKQHCFTGIRRLGYRGKLNGHDHHLCPSREIIGYVKTLLGLFLLILIAGPLLGLCDWQLSNLASPPLSNQLLVSLRRSWCSVSPCPLLPQTKFGRLSVFPGPDAVHSLPVSYPFRGGLCALSSSIHGSSGSHLTFFPLQGKSSINFPRSVHS